MPAEQHPKITATAWARLKAGDSYALGELYDAYVQLLYKFGKRHCQDDELLTDAIHDVFEDIWNYRATLSDVETSNIQFYLFKSLKTKLLKYLNRQARHTELTDNQEYLHEYVESAELFIVSQEIDRHQQHQLTQQIALLPKRQQEALLFRFYDNLSYDEIAELMSLTRHSVYNLIYKALSQLRDNWVFDLIFLVFIVGFKNF
ncbi:RNA polymerase sigma factor [Runella salmonicolor]|uniref:Sigma-70 family RNA polymerase sigma factor n=1 Tax=Runella salmonicolor TaxID=2950278 RepID=A0ABT1FT43_9BACT|nr:sigma-70 family RNA polymerase sigma factor [Runella salmonicolor]MCP1384939.1 sigma-70 family RNA polymerase sigma factor [Runella salmonicolor]